MTRYQTSERLPYSAQQMFDLVAAVDDYAEFMPLCERSVVTSRRDLDDGCEELMATLEVMHKKTGIGDRFESRVHIDRDNLTITAVSNTGPVRHLENKWAFRDLGDGKSEASFTIDYEMRHWPMQLLMNKFSGRAFEKIATAFRQRAGVLYG